jgi:hypothetical protein
LRETGAGRSILADKNGQVIAGNKTLEAWVDIGGEIVTVRTNGEKLVVVQREDLDLSDDTGMARKLAYYDNRAGEVGLEWDTEQLLADLNAGVDLLDFFRQDELDELLADLLPEKEVQDAPAQVDRAGELVKKWNVQADQLWQLDDHKIICGDCTDATIVKRILGDEQVSLVIADPPYGVSIVATNGYVGGGEGPNGMIPFGGVKGKRLGSVGGAKPFGSEKVRGSDGAANIVDVGKYAPIIGDETTDTALRSSAFYRDAYPKAVQVWWGANYYIDGLTPSACWLVWDKETTGNFADCELAWTNQDKAAKLFRHQWNGMLRESERERRWHPTQKPAALAAWVFTEFTEPGAIVVDPFAGAGWAVLGGEQSGRKVRAIEMSEEYIAIILQRWADATGKTPVLLDS